jgi:tRNA dimethylallyltransferase
MIKDSVDLFSYLYSPQKIEPINKNRKIIVIAGPTGIGKSDFSIKIAKAIVGEIISADSMQVYRGMDIGTAKMSLKERDDIPHHLIDIRDVKSIFNVVDFYYEAYQAVNEILVKEHVPIVTGGSGFYIHVFLHGPPMGPPANAEVRKYLNKQMDEMGPDVLYERLQILDPEYAQGISERDRHKIIRALEIIAITQKKVSDFPKISNMKNENYNYRCWFLSLPKEELFLRLDKRCDKMIQDGFIDEVIRLKKEGFEENMSASQAIGYKQCLDFLKTDQSEREQNIFIDKFKRATRHYVKKQLTWFKKDPYFRWLDLEQYDIEKIKEIILQDFEQSF